MISVVLLNAQKGCYESGYEYLYSLHNYYIFCIQKQGKLLYTTIFTIDVIANT